MNQREGQAQAFLESIRETPDDDTPRLIYADWLDDHDDEARAEFIRVQCELARLSAKDERRSLLEERERELLAANRATWLGPLDEVLPYDHCTFRRGFPEDLRIPPWTMVRLASEFTARVPVGRVTLSGSFGDPAMRALVRNRGMEWVAGLHYEHPRLTESGLVLLAEPNALPQLQELSIKFANFTTAGIRALAGSPHRRSLRQLGLHFFRYPSRVYAESATELAHDGVQFRLQKLRLYDHDIGPEAATALAGAEHFAELRELDLMLNRIGDDGATALARSPHLRSLSALNLYFNRLTTQAVRDLVDSPLLGGIRHLDLGCNEIGDEGAEALAASPRLAQLTRLHLRMCRLTDRGAEALAASPSLSQLTTLQLDANTLTDRGSRALFDSPHLQRLDRVWIRGEISPKLRKQWTQRLGKGAYA